MENKLYVDVVSQAIISKLSDEIVTRLVSSINEANRSFFKNEFPALIVERVQTQTDQIVKMTDLLENNIFTALNGLKEDLQEVLKDNRDERLAVEKRFDDIAGQTQAATKDLRRELDANFEHQMQAQNKAAMAARENMDRLAESSRTTAKDLGADINKYAEALQEQKESLVKLHDSTNGLFYAVKKQLTAAGTDKEAFAGMQNRNSTQLSEIERALGAHQEKETQARGLQEQLLKEIRGHLATVGDKLDYAKGKGTDLVSLMEKRTRHQMGELKQELLQELERRLDGWARPRGAGDDDLHQALIELKEALTTRESESDTLLNSIYYATRKLIKSFDARQDDGAKTEIQLTNSLDVLYGHIRRLESEKDDLGLELLRLGGDGFKKEKLALIEQNLKQQTTLAEKYLREKDEIQERFDQLEALWENSLGSQKPV